MKQTGATLIFATTTPYPADNTGKYQRLPGDDVAYNNIAKKVMREEGVAVDDLYSCALPKLAQIQVPHDVHFTKDGSEQLATQVAASIETALKQRPGAGSPGTASTSAVKP
jgi:acyl-CoA thioesterase-1